MDTKRKNKVKNQGNGLINLHLELELFDFFKQSHARKKRKYSAFGFKAIPRRVPVGGR